jgi:hypothetical protein
MGTLSRTARAIDTIDLMILMGFACVVGGVALQYGLAFAAIVFGLGLMTFGGLALWRRT